jgi:hypothetical protein
MRHTECHELLALPLPAPHNTAVVQGMLNNQRNDLQYDKDKRVSRFIANRSSRLLACLFGRQILAARDSMLRMPCCICCDTGGISHTLHKQALHHIFFLYGKGYWCWYEVVVVGAGSFVPTSSCALPAAADLGSRVRTVAAALVATGSSDLSHQSTYVTKLQHTKHTSRAETQRSPL